MLPIVRWHESWWRFYKIVHRGVSVSPQCDVIRMNSKNVARDLEITYWLTDIDMHPA